MPKVRREGKAKVEELTPKQIEKINVSLVCNNFGGKIYGGGYCYVTFGTQEFLSIALKAGGHKHVTTLEHAPTWLKEHGLPDEQIKELLEAVREHHETNEPKRV